MKKIKTKSVLPAGIIIGISAFILAGVAMKLTLTHPELTQAAKPIKNSPPFVCLNCNVLNGNIHNVGNSLNILLAGKDLSNAYITGLTSNGTDWTSAIFKGAFLQFIQSSGDDFTGVDFTNGTIIGILGDVRNGGSNFTNANFTNVNFNYLNSTSAIATFAEDTLTGANFTNATMTYMVFGSGTVDFTNANFKNANLTGISVNGTVTFTGANWSNTTCPDGTNSNNDGNTCIGHGF